MKVISLISNYNIYARSLCARSFNCTREIAVGLLESSLKEQKNMSIMQRYEPVSHVIFDLDGLLLDTEKIYEKVLNSIAMKYNKQMTHEVRMKVMGTVEADCAKIIVGDLNLPITPEEFSRQQCETQEKLLENPDLMPGAERLIRHLHSVAVPIAVATSSSETSMKIKTAKYRELFKLFNHVVCGSSDPDVKKGKPNPDIFLVCCSRFSDNPKPEKCLVLEDAPNGVQGALAAGMQVVMVPDPATEEEKRKQATVVLTSLNDFQPLAFGLPAFKN